MDESGRKSGNTSGSLKRRRSQLAGWLAGEGKREEGRPIVEQRELWEISVLRSAEKSTVAFGWREKLPRDSPIVPFKPLITPPPFSSNIHSYVPTAFRTTAGQLIRRTKRPYVIFPFESPRRYGFEKRRCFVRIVSRTSWLTSWLRSSHETGYS